MDLQIIYDILYSQGVVFVRRFGNLIHDCSSIKRFAA